MNFSWTICFQKIFQQNLSKFRPTLINSSVFGSELLQRVRFWIEILYFLSIFELNFHIASVLESRLFQHIRFRRKTLFLERQNCCKNSISKILYLVNSHRKNVKVSFFCEFLQKLFGKKIFLSIKNFWIIIFFKKSVLNRFLYDASYSESRHSNASDLEPFFTPRQLSNRKI